MILQSSTPNASIPDSSMLNTVTMRVRSTGKSEVYGGYTIANSVNGITLSNSDKVYRIPPFNEAPAPHASISDRYRVKEVTNGGDSLHALSPNTPGCRKRYPAYINLAHKSSSRATRSLWTRTVTSSSRKMVILTVLFLRLVSHPLCNESDTPTVTSDCLACCIRCPFIA
ncbi:hypothetical protein CPB85DRAFT_443143 [Mucidula mucida]|nr:hypothetical protein CPB85DRAFT_443143 [Mucidula mucida]